MLRIINLIAKKTMSSWRLFVRYSSYVLAWWNLYVMLHLMILLGYQPYDSLIYLPYYITSEYVIPFPLFHCAVFLFSELSDQSCLKFLHYLKFSNFFILEGKHTRFDFQVIETSKLPLLQDYYFLTTKFPTKFSFHFYVWN